MALFRCRLCRGGFFCRFHRCKLRHDRRPVCRKYGNLFILRQRLRRKGQCFIRMGQYLLPFQVCHDLVKYRIDGFPFRTLREGFQDCHFPAFICRESNGTIRMSRQIIRAVRQLILDVTGKGPGGHLRVAVPIAAVLFALLTHAHGIPVKIGFHPPDLRRLLCLHPGQHVLEYFQPFPLTFGDHPPGDRLLESADLLHGTGLAG